MANLWFMDSDLDEKDRTRSFVIDKWFLDFVSDEGLAMIFYAAKISWKGLGLPYVSWLLYHPEKGASSKHRFYDTKFPKIKGSEITWIDRRWKIHGAWVAELNGINERLYESERGELDWFCHQPSSKVELSIDNRIYRGKGYLEQLRLTVHPWEIPIRDLRWGRFVSKEHSLVWISFSGSEHKSWIWHNSKQVGPGLVEDDRIQVSHSNLSLIIDDHKILESEKKVLSVVRKLNKYLPGFERIVPKNFLMADEIKWLSHGRFFINGEEICSAPVIHERVNFNSS